MILNANGIKHSYSDKILLNDIFLTIDDFDKIGLIGVNGSGKSTLLSIIAKATESEYGDVSYIGSKSFSYMPQEVNLELDLTINEYLETFDEEIKLEYKSILTRLDVVDFQSKIKTLSYGTKRKIVLGKALAIKSDLLILDEPTNHLDSFIIEWLEKYLIKTKKAILMVTHDRYFLDRVCNTIAELDNGKLDLYKAKYSKYLELKALKDESTASQNRKLQAFLRKEYEWIKRGPRARENKDKRRIENYEELTKKVNTSNKTLSLESISTRLGNKTIELDNITYSINNRLLFDKFSMIFDRNSRVGIVGRNGSGKTTLLDIITKTIEPTSGTVEIGTTINISYFKQTNMDLDYSIRAIDYLTNIAPAIKTLKGEISVTVMLERFLFDDPYTYISKLSGGEKRRLYLLGELVKSPNVLILDEPTNDFDITTLSVLEEYLEEFNGIVIVVSHDRYFLDKVMNTILVIDNQKISIINGAYQDYYNSQVDLDSAKSKKAVELKPKPKSNKLTFNERIEFSTILNEINDLEIELKQLENDLNLNYHDFNISKQIQEKIDQVNEQLLFKMERWEYLSEKENN